MNKLRVFFYIFRNTFTSVDYYKKVLKAPVKFSMKFFWAFFVVYAILDTALIGYRYLWPLNDSFSNVFIDEVVNVFPEDLEIKIEGGAASANVDQPYYVSLDRLKVLKQKINNFDDRVLGVNNMDLQNILVVDTEAKIEDFPQYQSFALLTAHHLTLLNDKGNFESIPLSEVNDMVVNRQQIRDWSVNLQPVFEYFVPISITLVGVWLLIFLPLGRLVFVWFVALFLNLFYRLLGKTIVYKKVFQLCLHFVVISSTFFGLWNLFGFPIRVPFLETSLVVVLGILVGKRVIPAKQ